MRFIVLSCIVVAVSARAVTQNEGQCPPSSGMAGICVFRPGYNCLADSECQSDHKCCSEGCGRVCKLAMTKQEAAPVVKEKEGQCPPPSGMVGFCVFRPGYNCLSDSECQSGHKCCSEGCGRVCKLAMT
ncbi:WAP four-disulfide core domain protein 3-like [Patella vulgata]|uniref:WAP four-disulfide core domain protein 3-like n=1 Tax=Patella vulgata TaxID=6465 RepID=UPI0024A88355|nr:WAP four-disulfide core domain protein 3-like [Patella vulgata]